MPAAREFDVDRVAPVRVAPAELGRDVLVGVAVDEQHLDGRRVVDRRGGALREQALDGAGAGAEFGTCASTPRTPTRPAASSARWPPAL